MRDGIPDLRPARSAADRLNVEALQHGIFQAMGDTMFKITWLFSASMLLVAANPVAADDRDRLPGVWQIVSVEREYQTSAEKEYPRGKNPTGFLIFTPDGRVTALLTNEGRKAPTTDQDRAELFNTVVAYTGKYRIEGDKWIAKVDAAWNPALLGTEQARTFRFQGDRLQEITPWSAIPEKGMARAVLTWERAK
jgi:hypothetical protein